LSSMPNSPGSMVNQYRLDEDEDGGGLDTRDMFITVDNPESHVTAIETFVVYRVLTRVSVYYSLFTISVYYSHAFTLHC